MWDRGERATYMGKHLLMNTPIVRSILGMWLLTPEIKIPAETWISLWLRTDHKPGVTLTRCMWDARHLWTQLEGGSTGSAMMLKVHKHLQREVGRTCVLWEERWQNGGAGAFFFFFPNSLSSIHQIHLSQAWAYPSALLLLKCSGIK